MPLYHEKQSLALCAVHAVNNLLQRREYTKKDFDDVCLALSDSAWFNPHRSMLPIGDYDVNVVALILQRHDMRVTWWDQRQELQASDLDNCIGLIWNVPAPTIIGWLLRGRHWITLMADTQNETWVNLDSRLPSPEVIGSREDCCRLVTKLQAESHVLLVKRGAT